jgi:hypothetical protein
MSIIQRHIPAWDCVEAQRAASAHELALASIRDVFKLALFAATALKGVPGIEGSKREIYDRCCDSYLDIYEAPANADIGPVDFKKLRAEIWDGEHPAPPTPTFADFVAKMKVPARIVREVM